MKRLLQLSILFITILFISSCGSDSGGPNPEITSVQPESGPPGTSVTIAGKGFRPHGEMNVTFGGSSATLISATEDQIQTEVPDGLSEGSAPVEVSVEGETASGPSFMVEAKAPGISSVEPDSGTVGTEVTIKGMNFSPTASETAISFDGTSATVKSASETQLVTEVPQGATDGPIEVTVKQKSTTGPEFDVITEGVLKVYTNTTGDDKDSDRYDMFIDGTDVASIANSGIATFPDIEKGNHDLELSGIKSNCSVQGQNPRTANIVAGDTTSTTFDVQCTVPTKNKIAFYSKRDGDREIFIMDEDGSNHQKLTDNNIYDDSPLISNDGTKILFGRSESGNYGIYIMDADGTNTRKIVDATGPFCWSPDGTKIAFVDERNGNREIYTIKVDGTDETRLTNSAGYDGSPGWSPDGSKIAFASSRDGDSEIYIMDPNGGNLQQITNDAHQNYGARWSPDGSQIMFKSDRDNRHYEIYVMNADGAGQTRITNNSSDSESLPSWSPDGTHIVYSSDKETSYKIFKLNADGSGTSEKLSNNDTDRAPFWSPVK